MTRQIMQRPLTCFGAVVAGALLLFGGLSAQAEAQEREVGAESRTGLTVTIYNRDLGLVRDTRRIDFEAGENVLALGDVSPALRPETLALEGAGLSLLDQSFAFDLLSPQRLLEKSLGETVWVVRSHPRTGEETEVEAELLSVAGGVVLRIGERIETGDASGSAAGGRIAFRGVPEGLRRAPALVARLASDEAGARDLGIQYLTGGLTWQADYTAEINAAEDRLDLTGLVTLTNASGAAYPDARVRLVAGEVNQTGPSPVQRGAVAMMAEAAAPAPGMAAQAAGDQHLYEVPRPVSLADRETKQVLLLESRDVPVEKEFRFEELVQAQGGPEEVGPVSAAVVFRFDNDAEAGGPGQPLPGGTVRVYQPGGPDGGGGGGGGDGAPVFTGEDRIAHTPRGRGGAPGHRPRFRRDRPVAHHRLRAALQHVLSDGPGNHPGQRQGRGRPGQGRGPSAAGLAHARGEPAPRGRDRQPHRLDPRCAGRRRSGADLPGPGHAALVGGCYTVFS